MAALPRVEEVGPDELFERGVAETVGGVVTRLPRSATAAQISAEHRKILVPVRRRSARLRALRPAGRAAPRATAAGSAGSPACRPRSPRSSKSHVTSSTNSGTPPVRCSPLRRPRRTAHGAQRFRRPCARPRRDRGARARSRCGAGAAPGRAELGRAVARMKSGAWAPRSASASMRSSVVGSAQCRSSKASTSGWVRAPASTQAASAASWRLRNSSGDSFSARPGGSGASMTGASRGAYSAGSSPTEPSAASSSARRFSPSTSAPPKRTRPHSAIGCSGVFCNSCEDAHSTQVCGVSASRARNSSISRDLPRPGSPTISESCPSPRRARSQRRARMSSSSRAADQRRRRARAAASPAAAGAHDAVELRLFGHAFQFMRALVLGDEQPGDLPVHAQRDPYFSGRGGALHPRGDVGRLAVDLADGIDHDPPAVEPDAGGELGRAGRGVARVEVGERALDRERRAHGTLAVVLLRLRIAEQRHQTVAELLQHMAAERSHGGRGGVEVTPHQIAPVLGIEPRREARRAHEVAEHHRDRTALGGCGRSGGRWRGRGHGT